MKAYKSFRTARRKSNGKPFIGIDGFGDKDRKPLFIVLDDESLAALAHCSITLYTSLGMNKGSITLKHLNRLGNANHAEPEQKQSDDDIIF